VKQLLSGDDVATAPENEIGHAISTVARSCGALSIECSDVAGYVEGVSNRIRSHLKTLDQLEDVTASLLTDQARVADSTDEARLLSEQARTKLDDGRAAIDDTIEVFKGLTQLVTQLGERVAGFAAAMENVQNVSATIESIARKTNMLALNATIEAARAGDAGRSFAVVAAEVKKLAHDTRDATAKIGQTIQSLTDEARGVITEIHVGVDRAQAAQGGFAAIGETVGEVAEIVAMVDAQTEGIAHSTNLIQGSVDRVKAGLSAFATDARENSGRLVQAHARLGALEQTSNVMLDTLANTGVPLDDTRFIEIAKRGHREVLCAIERGLDGGVLTEDALFDFDYRPMPRTDPQQWETRLCAFADAHIQPLLDALMREDKRVRAGALVDINGYLPTHISAKSQPQRPGDPAWNAEHCRNRRNFMDEITRRATESEREFMLATFRMDLGEGRYMPVKNVFVPMFIRGRRYGNFELAYLDEVASAA